MKIYKANKFNRPVTYKLSEDEVTNPAVVQIGNVYYLERIPSSIDKRKNKQLKEVDLSDPDERKDIINYYNEQLSIFQEIPFQEEILEVIDRENILVKFSQEVKRFTRERIYSRINSEAQMNLLADYTTGDLSDADKETYNKGLLWVTQTRDICKDVISQHKKDYAESSIWPELPEEVKELVSRY